MPSQEIMPISSHIIIARCTIDRNQTVVNVTFETTSIDESESFHSSFTGSSHNA